MTTYASIQEALVHGTGRERQFLCHVHGDTNASASVNSLTGLWICYACHASGKVDLDGVTLDPYALRRRINEIEERVAASKVNYPEGWLNYFDASGPGEYWLSRFSEEVCREHRLGQTPDGKHATIPLRTNDGTVSGVIRRSLTGSRTRYEYPYQARLSERLYGLHRASSDVLFITEGATDTVAIDEITPGHAVALYGNRMSKAQAKLLYRYAPKVILTATDQDEGGDAAHTSIVGQMGGFCTVLRLTWDTYKDLAAIPVPERSELINWAISTYDLPSLARVG